MEKKYVIGLMDQLTREGRRDEEILNELWQQLKPSEHTKEPEVLYGKSQKEPILFDLIATLRKGLSYSQFRSITQNIPLDNEEWTEILHLSRRTMNRYKEENRFFDTRYAERILEIRMLYDLGEAVFGNTEKFNTWLSRENVVLGNVVPKTLLDTTMGIEMVKDQLIRIDYGVLA